MGNKTITIIDRMAFRLFPGTEWTFRTGLSPEEVLLRLREHLLKTNDFHRQNVPEDHFFGEIEGNYFLIQQWQRPGHRGGKEALPVVSGVVTRELDGTVIRLNMEVHGCVVFFVMVWSYVPLLMLLMAVTGYVREGKIDLLFVVVPLAAWFVMYWIVTGGFRNGERAVRAFMEQTFEGELVEK